MPFTYYNYILLLGYSFLLGLWHMGALSDSKVLWVDEIELVLISSGTLPPFSRPEFPRQHIPHKLGVSELKASGDFSQWVSTVCPATMQKAACATSAHLIPCYFVFALLGSSRGLDRSVAESYASSIPDVTQIEPSKQHVFKYVAQGASSLL